MRRGFPFSLLVSFVLSVESLTRRLSIVFCGSSAKDLRGCWAMGEPESLTSDDTASASLMWDTEVCEEPR